MGGDTREASTVIPSIILHILLLFPGKQVKNWSKYHALRTQGMSKAKAAKITNAAPSKRRKKK